MYDPAPFRESDVEPLHGPIDAHPFGLLLVARANPVWRLALEREATVVFTGPHGYVSPRWYERPHEEVPTWNYAVVHAHGRSVGSTPDAKLVALLDDLAARFDGAEPGAWRTSRLAEGDRDGMLREIVGLALPIGRLEGKFKLSQNRSEADRARVVAAFGRRGGADDLEMARLMSR